MRTNRFRAANRSRTFQPPFSKLRVARHISLVAASPVGSDPRVLIDLRNEEGQKTVRGGCFPSECADREPPRSDRPGRVDPSRRPCRTHGRPGPSPWASDHQWRHPGSIHSHSPGSTRRLTLGADKGNDASGFVADLRQAFVTPHAAQKARYSAFDGRATRHEGFALSRKHRKRIEVAFGRAKTVVGMAQTMYRGVDRVRSRVILTMGAHNLARRPRLLTA